MMNTKQFDKYELDLKFLRQDNSELKYEIIENKTDKGIFFSRMLFIRNIRTCYLEITRLFS